jgi:hypothetical protein
MKANPMQSRLLAIRTLEASSPIWEPPDVDPSVPTTTLAIHQTRDAGALPEALEAALVAVLTSPRGEGESHAAAGERKERELTELLDPIEPAIAFHVGRRLDVARAGDPLVAAFARLSPDRRARVRAYVADTRRRVALRDSLRAA